jgi:leucyl-tRNA synthetase
MGPFDQAISWSEESVEGCYRLVGKLWRAFNENVSSKATDKVLKTKLHQTIKKVDEDIQNLKFNTIISSIMEFFNMWNSVGDLNVADAKLFCTLLAPFTPHLAEEVWQILKGHMVKQSKGLKTNKQSRFPIYHIPYTIYQSVHSQPWPTYNPKLIIEDTVIIPIQVNGKLRATIEIDKEKETNKEYVLSISKDNDKIQKWLASSKVAREIYIKGKLVNFVLQN